MNLRLSNSESSQSRKDGVISYLHQCKQWGVLFEWIGKTGDSELGEFWRVSKFMEINATCVKISEYLVSTTR